jgi:hypothetical protein
MGDVRTTLRRWHVWLCWLVALPMLFWTVSGLVMAAKPLEEVRGDSLVAPLKPIQLGSSLVVPQIEGRPVTSFKLESRFGGPRWIISFADGESRQADVATGKLLPKLGAADAAREVASRITSRAKVVETSRVDAKSPPLELRHMLDGWRVTMDDGTNYYVDGGSGAIVAQRTGWWRIYDFMWGLHILDLQGRSNTNNPWVVTFVALSIAMVLLGLALLPMTIRRRNGGNGNGSAPAK